MSVRSSYNKDIPFFIIYQFTWNNGLHRRRGTSAETNTLENFTFDVPSILESVKSAPRGPLDIEEEPFTEENIEANNLYKDKKPVEVIFDEIDLIEEPVKKSSNWWLWLVGLIIVVGGLVLLRRKK